MAGTPERVKAFLDDIDRVVRPIGEADAARMLARLRQDDPSLGALNSWSTSYASRLVRKEDYDVAPEQVRQYFAFDKVPAGLLALAPHLFGVEIRPRAPDVWAPDVSAYEKIRTEA